MARRKSTIINVRSKMKADAITQQQVAAAVGVSQGHLSRVLRHELPLTQKLSNRLDLWLQAGGKTAGARTEIHEIVDRLLDRNARGQALLVNLLRALEG